MAHTIKHIGKLVLPVAALSLSIFGMAAGSSAHSTNDNADDAPLNCEIAVSTGRYGHTYEGIIHANSTVKGTYELNIHKRGSTGRAMISQSGDFYVSAGQTETLGRATFGGLPPDSVNVELILDWKGHKMTCTNLPTEL